MATQPHFIACEPGPAESVELMIWPDTGEPCDAVPGSARRLGTVIDVDGDTAPEPSGEILIKLYRDGTWSVTPRREGM